MFIYRKIVVYKRKCKIFSLLLLLITSSDLQNLTDVDSYQVNIEIVCFRILPREEVLYLKIKFKSCISEIGKDLRKKSNGKVISKINNLERLIF